MFLFFAKAFFRKQTPRQFTTQKRRRHVDHDHQVPKLKITSTSENSEHSADSFNIWFILTQNIEAIVDPQDQFFQLGCGTDMSDFFKSPVIPPPKQSDLEVKTSLTIKIVVERSFHKLFKNPINIIETRKGSKWLRNFTVRQATKIEMKIWCNACWMHTNSIAKEVSDYLKRLWMKPRDP